MSEDFIEIFSKNVSVEVCNSLIEWFDRCHQTGHSIHNMPLIGGSTSKLRRSDEAISIPTQSVSSISIPVIELSPFWEALNLCYIDYSQKYEIQDFNASCLKFNIHKVIEGQGYHQWHWETLPDSKMGERVLTWMTFLKVPEEGGETEFLYQHLRVNPKKNMAVLWPGAWTHMHRGNPPISGSKFILTGWFVFSDDWQQRIFNP